MWVRTQLKIGFGDLITGLAASYRRLDRAAEQRKVESYFPGPAQSIAVYSVRSGFDLMLQALGLKPGDEVIFSALNVKAMIKVISELGLVAVPVDVDLATMGPRLDKLREAITPRSKVFVAAHLFGSRSNLDLAFEFAKGHGLLAVEDCAQAFNGRDYLGSPQADVAMYSFGPIKTSTALGGGILRVKSAPLFDRMREIQSRYPVQSDRNQRKRIRKFIALKMVTWPSVLGAIFRYYNARGKDYEDSLADKVRDVAPLKSLEKMRFQCSATLLWMMNRRLQGYVSRDVTERQRKGETLTSMIGSALDLPGQANAHHDYWVYPLLVRNPKQLIKSLREAGFDAADLPRSQHIAAPPDRPEMEPLTAAGVMRDIVIVPCYTNMPDSELERQAEIIKQTAET
jgi:perosamine synthetase